MFVKIVDGVQIIAPTKYTTDDGYVINDFIRYLETMHELGQTDKMYGFEYADEVIKITIEEKLAKLEEENEKLKVELEVTQDALDQLIFNNMGV